MHKDELKQKSKFLSLVLRHQPQVIDIALDSAGWVSVDDLMAGLQANRRSITLDQLETIVKENDKQRFEFSDDRKRIRARQGHSVQVELGYQASEPPEVLHHGTPQKFVASIRTQGLTKQKRHHVHLHQDTALATSVGQRRGQPVVLVVKAKEMFDVGHKFYVTPNGVWLTDCVPAEFIVFPETLHEQQ